MTSIAAPVSAPVVQRQGSMARREAVIFYLCVAPWVIGFVLFTLGPMIASLYLSFTDWNILTSPIWVGLQNYIRMFTRDTDFWIALQVTARYAVFSIPLRMATALFLAVLLNEAVYGVSFFRTAFYLPAIVAAVAAAVLWQWILNPRFGPMNGLLRVFGIAGPNWLSDPTFVPWALVLMSVWGIGGEMLIFLAGLKGIPSHLYEAAELDGANRPARFFNITLPMLSPTIFFNLVMSIIGSFQTFDSAYVFSTARAGTLGGPLKSTLFYMVYVYNKAFGSSQAMGYASALAWVLFLIILVLTLVTIRSSAVWVYSEAEKGS